jgi:hypothetical protein
VYVANVPTNLTKEISEVFVDDTYTTKLRILRSLKSVYPTIPIMPHSLCLLLSAKGLTINLAKVTYFVRFEVFTAVTMKNAVF